MNLDGTFNVYKGMNKELEGAKPKGVNYARFGITGKPDFSSLDNLKDQGIKRLLPLLPEHRICPKETWVYSAPYATIIISANYETNYHEVDIALRGNPDDQNIINNIKSALEEKLKLQLTDITKSISNLIEDVGKN